LRVANVYADELRLENISDIGVADGELQRVLLQRDDLLIVEGNGSPDQIGRVALWDGSISPCAHQNHIIKARFADPSMARWAMVWLSSLDGRAAINRVASSTSGLHTLSISKIASLPIPIPPLAEQHRITLEVSRQQSILSTAAAAVARDLSRVRAIRRAVLRAAFRGELA
jgi:type I restriction enzyme S subunit